MWQLDINLLQLTINMRNYFKKQDSGPCMLYLHQPKFLQL
jgi:hypothetical protein